MKINGIFTQLTGLLTLPGEKQGSQWSLSFQTEKRGFKKIKLNIA